MNSVKCPQCGRDCSRVEVVGDRTVGYCNHGDVSKPIDPVIDTLTSLLVVKPVKEKKGDSIK